MSKKIIALVLAVAMVFSTMTVAFADQAVSAEVQALAAVGMLEGDGNGVTVEYTQKEMDRFTAAISLLKLKGLYEDALAFEGEANFADIEEVKWAEGKNVLAYIKANPEIGFAGDPTTGKFNPYAKIDEQSYIKVLLETLGYKQTTAEVAGDFAWEETIEFAATIGLIATEANPFTIDALSKLTVSAFKSEMKDGKLLIEALIEAGRVDREVAAAHGLVAELEVAVKSAKAIGNTVVEVTFDGAVNEAAEDVALYEIEGLEVKEAVVAGEDVVRLTTDAMTTGKIYTLTVGEVAVKFTGVAKVTGAPSIEKVESVDVEEVVITFDKAVDFETATDVENYTIAGVEVVKAEVDGKEVTLTTEGLANRKQYTVKVTGVESVDGGLLKSASKSFYTRFDTSAPTVKGEVDVQTNQRLVVTFNEKVTKESAEDLENYTIMAGTTELAVLDAVWDADDEDSVELTTEVQQANKRYELTISNIADQTKAGNVMTKAVKKSFYGKREDTISPSFQGVNVISRNHIEVTFNDASRFDEATILDVNNYTLTKSSEDLVVENAEKVSFKNGTYKVLLTVADLDLGTYSLKIENIADEFGNVIKEVKRVFSVTRDNFASSTVSGYEVVDTDTIKITFTKSLNEATAEDLANYTINNSIGAPIKAKYEDKVVTLDTAEFVEGKTYKITIKGVEDLAGNVLDLSFNFIAKKGTVDTESPELVDVYAVNEYVVAVVFDEAVKYTQNTTQLLLDSNNDGIADLTLKAKAYAEDDTVIEFSAATLEDATKLSAVNGYTIAAGSLTGIKDAAGNGFDPATANIADYIVYGNDAEAEAPEVLSIAQINGTTFQVTLSKDVKIVKSSDNGYSIAYDDADEKAVVNFTKNTGKISDSIEYVTFNLSDILSDMHGIKVENLDSETETRFYVEFEDEEKPFIVNVVAKDRKTVEIEYSEEMDSTSIGSGSYTIKNADDSIKTTIGNTAEVKSSNKKIVKLTLSTPLEGRYDYKLIIGTRAAKDLAGNTAEEAKDDEFYFNGTDLVGIDEDSLVKPGVETAVMSFTKGTNGEKPADVNAVVEEAGTKVTFTVAQDTDNDTIETGHKLEKVVVNFLDTDTAGDAYAVKLVSGTGVESEVADFGTLAKNGEVWEMTTKNPQTFMTAGTWNLSVEIVDTDGNTQVINIILVVEAPAQA